MCDHNNTIKMHFHHGDFFYAKFSNGHEYSGYGFDDSKNTDIKLCLDCGMYLDDDSTYSLQELREHVSRVSKNKDARNLADKIMYFHVDVDCLRMGEEEWSPPEGLDEPEHEDDLDFLYMIQDSEYDHEFEVTSEQVNRLNLILARVESHYEQPMEGGISLDD